jgi:hypothetical protein
MKLSQKCYEYGIAESLQLDLQDGKIGTNSPKKRKRKRKPQELVTVISKEKVKKQKMNKIKKQQHLLPSVMLMPAHPSTSPLVTKKRRLPKNNIMSSKKRTRASKVSLLSNLDQGIPTTNNVYKRYWSDDIKELSKTLWFVTKAGYINSDLNCWNGSFKKTMLIHGSNLK